MAKKFVPPMLSIHAAADLQLDDCATTHRFIRHTGGGKQNDFRFQIMLTPNPKEAEPTRSRPGGEVTIGVMSQNLWSTYFSLVGRDRFGRLRSFAEALSKCEKQVLYT